MKGDPRKQSSGSTTPNPEGEDPEPLLSEEAHRYDFFQAVRLLERRFKDAPRLGSKGPARKERIRLRPSTSLGFPTSEVEQAIWLDQGRYAKPRVELVANFLGLVGRGSPLPITYAQEILWLEDEQPQMREFLDIFHHRMLSLLYRSWLTYRYEFAFEEGGHDRLSKALLDLIGLSPDMREEDLGLHPTRVLRYLGLFLMPDRPASALEAFLSEELGVAISVLPLTPRWIPVPGDQVFTMDPGQRQRGFLGRDIVIGTRVLDRSGHVTLEVGPVSYARMDGFRPGQPEGKRMMKLLRLFVRQPLDMILNVQVSADEIPPLRLSRESGVRLGQTAHMGTPKGATVTLTFEHSVADSSLGLGSRPPR